MKKIRFLMLLVLVIQMSCERHVSININDGNFLKSLIRQGVDKNRDGEISPGEAESMTGCDYNHLTTLDVSQKTKLVRSHSHLWLVSLEIFMIEEGFDDDF